MYLPARVDLKAKRCLIFLPQPELSFFKSYLPLKPLTTYLGIKLFQVGETLVCGPIFSAQMVGFLFELLAQAEVKRLLFYGWGGSLNKTLDRGQLFLPVKAYSKLGLTKEVYPKRRVFYPSSLALRELEMELAKFNLSYRVGAIISVDYPFLYERGKELPRGMKADVLDMEASALFALGEHSNIDVAGLIFVTDRVGELTLTKPEGLKSLRRMLLPLFKSFVEKDT